MSRQIINEYRAELDRLRAVSGVRRESVLREAFKDLLKRWGRQSDLQFIAEHDLVTQQGNRIYLDGALLHGLRVPFGYWEAKDEQDDLQAEIEAKFRKGYPRDNIVFTDDVTAVLWQDGRETRRASMEDADDLLILLNAFFDHERKEIADFNKAVGRFAHDLPDILAALRDRIASKLASSPGFDKAVKAFLRHARIAINPSVSDEDVREMLIQHILTEDIFAKVYNDPDFHRKNNVAAELYKLEDALFARGEKATLLRALDPYYSGIASTAALIQSHSEKQGFLKALYEDFYKAYNRKAADRLGVVYTPNEIVRFMIRSADWLCETHFGKNLVDRGVEILDPATGTGTFVVELLEHFRGNREKLRHKYREEIHANEVAILPYYVANLNIEATYQAITREFVEFQNLCLVDTLDAVDGLGIHAGHQFDLLGSLTDENVERIRRQNGRKISVIIGNPPYNANQQNENDDNKNRAYPHVDERIKATYIKESTARKPKSYDMYARFYRWATDRLSDEGVLAFVTNRSFIWAKTYDGFRKLLMRDFAEVWVCDLGGDWKQKGDGGGDNVFGIATGVAVCFLVRKGKQRADRIRYGAQPRERSAEDRLAALDGGDLVSIADTIVRPDEKGTWIDAGDTGFDDLLPVISEKTKRLKTNRGVDAVFRTYTNGINTARDAWVYGRSPAEVERKTALFSSIYAKHRKGGAYDKQIKWSRNLKKKQQAGAQDRPLGERIIEVSYRPFSTRFLYNSSLLIDEPGLAPALYPHGHENPTITISDTSSRADWACFSSSFPIDFHFGSTSDGYKGIPRYYFTKDGDQVDNVTDWALARFVAHYGKPARVTKDDVFHYVYAVLHDPAYRSRYALNLKRAFPRIPLHPDFPAWVERGRVLMALHLGYADVEPWGLQIETRTTRRANGTDPKPVLKSLPADGVVRVDDDTQVGGIPTEAWRYRIGSRSAIDWVLDQYRPKKSRDATVQRRFNDYRFADHKEELLRLLARVVQVSVTTASITDGMEGAGNVP